MAPALAVPVDNLCLVFGSAVTWKFTLMSPMALVACGVAVHCCLMCLVWLCDQLKVVPACSGRVDFSLKSCDDALWSPSSVDPVV